MVLGYGNAALGCTLLSLLNDSQSPTGEQVSDWIVTRLQERYDRFGIGRRWITEELFSRSLPLAGRETPRARSEQLSPGGGLKFWPMGQAISINSEQNLGCEN